MLDTGASTTVVHLSDAITRIGLTVQQLSAPQAWPSQSVEGVGGTVSQYVLPAFYGFIFGDGSTKAIEGQIRIAPLTPASERLPSLLGWDVLQHFDLGMSWRHKAITLEEITNGL